MKAILLHHAGGDKYAYRNVEQWLSPEIKSVAIEIPGRGDRYSEALVETIDEIIEDIFQQIKSELHEAYFFVGMSMGAVLAFLLTHKIQSLQLPLPKHLFLAARLPFQHYETNQQLSKLTSDEFWEFILEYDERAKAIMDNHELRELFEPILKADFLAMQSFDEQFAHLTKLPIPCSILYGKEDVKMFDAEQAKRWNDYFVELPEYKSFQGGHFFLYENKNATDYIKQQVNF